MGRLTKRTKNGTAWASPTVFMSDCLDRLADYEDTGYTPEEIKAMEAELSNLRFDALMNKNIEWDD